MKKLLFCLLLLAGLAARGQNYYNEWIDYSKTYYKFKVGATGLYRIPQATLQTAGLGGVPAQQFQLWRNGVEVPLYTSVASGPLSGSDYIEFWGLMNDGGPDSLLYRERRYQLNNRWSLETDTATYFLTVNAGANKRLATTANNVNGTTLAPEPWFLYTAGKYFKDLMNQGYAVNVGDYMYSSSYDRGEGWTTGYITTGNTMPWSFSGLFPYTGAGAPKPLLVAAIAGNATNPRNYRLTVNGDSVLGGPVNFFNELVDSNRFEMSTIAGGTANLNITNITSVANDRMVVHRYELTYPRLFNFGAATTFEFSLPATAVGQYLQITNFSAGTAAPVLYDLTNGLRLVANTDVAGQFRFVLPPSATDHNLVLVRGDGSTVSPITALQTRTFTDYMQAQADYLIISNPILAAGANGSNPLEEYRAYRASADGGSYNAKIFWFEDLADQFAFGIKNHPIAIVNFARFARNRFNVAPKHVFLIGKGVVYNQARGNEANPLLPRVNLVPTFGNPASDNLLTAEPGSSQPRTPVGRLSVVNPAELAVYLAKVKQFELNQRTPSPLIASKAWMKNVVHLAGSTEPQLLSTLSTYLNQLKTIISDTFFGAKVTTFIKNSPNTVEQINNGELDRLFAEGISLITYFGHSAASHLEYNLNNPDQYNNPGKYPLFVALGCNVGNVYNFSTARLSALETISEQYTMAPNRGSIGFIASSHFGITDYLQNLSRPLYYNLGVKNYGHTIGEIMMSAVADMFAVYNEGDFYARATAEESNLNGDPALRLNPHPKPDYVIEDPLVRVSPGFVSVADNSFHLTAQALNIGRAINQPVVIEVKRTFPAGNSQIIYRDTLPGIRYIDSVGIDIAIDPNRDKGLNRITVTIDPDNTTDEIYENNNSVTKDLFIYEDEARPVYPYNFAIVNRQNIRFVASTANPFASNRAYRMEIDTTERFNSALKVTTNLTSPGGILEFQPTISFRDSTVYYWRVAEVANSGDQKWSNSSFIYIPGNDSGFNQSHYYQNLHSTYQRMHMDTVTRRFRFNEVTHEIFLRHGLYPNTSGQANFYTVSVDGIPTFGPGCLYDQLIFNVIDSNSFRPWLNQTTPTGGLYGSNALCNSGQRYNFLFMLNSAAQRKAAMDFIDRVPAGDYVIMRSAASPTTNTYVDAWKADTLLYGSGNSLYHRLYNQGFLTLDSINRPRGYAIIFKKDRASVMPPVYYVQSVPSEPITFTAIPHTPDSMGTVTSPQFGPAAAWKRLLWDGASLETPRTDSVTLSLLGIRGNGTVDTLMSGIRPGQNDIDISSVSAATYPYLSLQLNTKDTAHYTPWQLKYWRLLYSPKAEGAVAPNLLFQMKDTFDVGEPITLKMAFKNISDVAFDSLRVKAVVTDQSNVARTIPLGRYKPLVAGDTITVQVPIDSRRLVGTNTLYVDVNPDNDQPELYHFNNFIFKNFYVRGDSLNPLLDVTFDNHHIMDGDIVSAKPSIDIVLKDESRYRLLDDTSLISVQVVGPTSNDVRTYSFNSDTLRFEPATAGAGDNQATVRFRPGFTEDGEYTLIVTGKDKSGNTAGRMDYKVKFTVINKPMISNMLNYPNPFTTSTAFVFTITGSEVPQNIRIQILTITGKVVREITKEELGPLRIGSNITEFKWDGTDQYGQKLANGVYLYRVVTNLNGQSLDKFTNKNEKTDKYFNKGYGKMYLMR
ncbi:C25 family cysteine peptidase [Flaviaesturariibacter flavus]|nr:C25 family cysteine peptidase [Flaviaesturariibacter flavus]